MYFIHVSSPSIDVGIAIIKPRKEELIILLTPAEMEAPNSASAIAAPAHGQKKNTETTWLCKWNHKGIFNGLEYNTAKINDDEPRRENPWIWMIYSVGVHHVCMYNTIQLCQHLPVQTFFHYLFAHMVNLSGAKQTKNVFTIAQRNCTCKSMMHFFEIP